MRDDSADDGEEVRMAAGLKEGVPERGGRAR
jgi:hypothetical protein